MRHPFEICATYSCCCCFILSPQVTCLIIAVICVVINGFSGIINLGVNSYLLYTFSIFNLLLHVLAGLLLFLGAIWEKNYLKLCYCWITFIGIFTVILGLVAFIFYRTIPFLIWGEKCHFPAPTGLIIVAVHSAWLIIWDIYTPMIVLGSGLIFGWNFSRMEETDEDKILHLYAQENWEEIIEKFDKNKFLPWVWPEKKNLEFIGKCVRSQNLKSLISVGCGSGLLEWLLASATGLEVIGIEIDRNWWKSKYSSGTFIPMVLTEDPKKGELKMETRDSALLFCYFNNLRAFLNYVDNFKGSCLIVIGPGQDRGTYTIPEPFDLPDGLEKSWKLSDHQEIRSSKDFIAVYVRK